MGGESKSPIPPELLGGRSRTRSPSLTGPGTAVPTGTALRVAFAGRTSTEDKQDPTLSLPRQLANSQAALLVLPARTVLVAHFYDVESGRKDLETRGFGRGYERLHIPIPRDGGIQDLLAEAAQPDRRFDVVICESVDRIARRTYVGTQIEHRLEQLGIPLWASDEPINLNGKRSSQVLTRRVKQGVAEWYVLEMLEKSWGGFEIHTEQGFNVGRPPYGYLPQQIPHPVAARREQGATKHVLIPDPVRAPVVQKIYELRVVERLGYEAIADRLNRDLDMYPPPVATAKARTVGRWTYSSVRAVLTNPKYTGYMVWNRRATSSAAGRINPPEAWVWSSKPTHPGLVTIDVFVQAQQVAQSRKGSRSAPGPNTACSAKRAYKLRSYMACGLCGRRMFGKESRGRIYYVCRPKRAYLPEGHPLSIWVREEPLLAGLTEFFNREIFGTHRRERLQAMLAQTDENHIREHQERITAIRAQIADLSRRKERILDPLETTDDPTPAFIHLINERAAKIAAEIEAKQQALRDLKDATPETPCPDLLNLIPAGAVDLDLLPEPVLRGLLDAFALQMRYDHEAGTVDVQITITPATVDIQRRTARTATAPHGDGRNDHAAVLVVPPTGFEPALPP